MFKNHQTDSLMNEKARKHDLLTN